MTTHVVSLEEFVAQVGKLPEQVEGACLRGLRSTALWGVGVASEEIATASPHPAVDTGELMRSVDYARTNEGAQVVVDAPHAGILELGSRPHRPPIGPLAEWAQRKFGVSATEALGIAFAVANKIEQDGTEPRHYMAKATARMAKRLPLEVESELAKL